MAWTRKDEIRLPSRTLQAQAPADQQLGRFGTWAPPWWCARTPRGSHPDALLNRLGVSSGARDDIALIVVRLDRTIRRATAPAL